LRIIGFCGDDITDQVFGFSFEGQGEIKRGVGDGGLDGGRTGVEEGDFDARFEAGVVGFDFYVVGIFERRNVIVALDADEEVVVGGLEIPVGVAAGDGHGESFDVKGEGLLLSGDGPGVGVVADGDGGGAPIGARDGGREGMRRRNRRVGELGGAIGGDGRLSGHAGG